MPVKVLDELTSERGYGMPETFLPDPVEPCELLRLLASVHGSDSLLVLGYAVGPVPPIRQEMARLVSDWLTPFWEPDGCEVPYAHVARQWDPLKRLRHKRLHVSEQYDRLAAKQVAATSQNRLVVVGYPKGIKYTNPKGNGKPRQRKTLAGWAYGRMVRFIQEECAKLGVPTEAPDERWSSRTCHRCGSRNTERLTQSILHCWNCELIYNADYNSSINIGSRYMPKAAARRATDDLAYARNEQAREIVACEPRSPHSFMGGS